MKDIFGIPYFNLKKLCLDIKRWENETCSSDEVTISYFRDSRLYFAQHSHIFMPNADEHYRANFLIHFKGNKRKALDFLEKNDLKPRNTINN
jgi:hypothetical protein